MSKEERYIYHCDEYDYIETIYDNKECEECDSVRMATNWLNRLNNKIYDLEEKLAEKRQDCVALDKAWNNVNNQLSVKDDEINELKQQLAEKEKEILDTEEKWIKWGKQDKISFAVEQLKKVKIIIQASVRDDHIIWDFDIKAHIDQLIKEIKGTTK